MVISDDQYGIALLHTSSPHIYLVIYARGQNHRLSTFCIQCCQF